MLYQQLATHREQYAVTDNIKGSCLLCYDIVDILTKLCYKNMIVCIFIRKHDKQHFLTKYSSLYSSCFLQFYRPTTKNCLLQGVLSSGSSSQANHLGLLESTSAITLKTYLGILAKSVMPHYHCPGSLIHLS